MVKCAIDSRIILALSELTGDADRDLNKIFVFAHETGETEYFATNGHAAAVVLPTEPKMNFDGNFVATIPDCLKKVIKYKENEANQELNKVFFEYNDETFEDFAEVKVWTGNEFLNIRYSWLESKFEELPNVLTDKVVDKSQVVFNPEIGAKIKKCAKKLGIKSPLTWNLGKNIFFGEIQDENFILKYCFMGESNGYSEDECGER